MQATTEEAANNADMATASLNATPKLPGSTMETRAGPVQCQSGDAPTTATVDRRASSRSLDIELDQMDEGKGVPDKWAVLIGIEFYGCPGKPATTPRYDHLGNKLEYKTLNGCVNDVLALEQYLIGTINVNPNNITKFLAPKPGRKYPFQLGTYRSPTQNNILDALQVPKGAKQGDFLYIHFSGHGARATTVFPALKERGVNDVDHALVPSDITHGGNYIRDLEIGVLLQAMVDAGLIVTVVLDCCHSGGAIRGDDDPNLGETRGISGLYKSNLVLDLPGNMDRITHWGCQPLWMRTPQGFVVLAACEEHQEAIEIEEGGHHYGLLTHMLLSTLRIGPVGFSSQALYQGVRDKVQNWNRNRNQTPYLIGDNDRFFFSDKIRSRVHALAVSEACVNSDKELRDQQVRLAGGKLHGVEESSEYAILPLSFDLGKRMEETDIIARVRVKEVMTGESTASFVQMYRARCEEIVEGCPAVLQRLPIKKRSTVYFSTTDDKARQDFERDWHEYDGNRTWLNLEKNDSDASFTISIAESGNFEIREQSGTFTQAIRNVVRVLPAAAPNSMPALIRRLEHLARFKMTKALSNPGLRPGTSSALISTKVDAPTDIWKHPSGREVPPAKIKELMGTYELDEERLFRVTIKNESDRPLGCAVLNCGAEFGVEQLFPPNEPYYRLHEGEAKEACFWMEVAPELRASSKDGVPVLDTLKVFVCDPPKNLDALQLSSLADMEDTYRRSDTTRSGINRGLDDLEELLSDLNPIRRGVHAAPVEVAPMKVDWETFDIRLSIKPKE